MIKVMKVMKAYEPGGEMDAVVLMAPRKYAAQTGYYCTASRGQVVMDAKGKSAISLSAYLYVSLSISLSSPTPASFY